MNYSALLKLMISKEKIHYFRLFALFPQCDGFVGKIIAYPIIFLLITFFHYCFAAMHFMFETYMYLFNREQFELNIAKLSNKLT